MRWSLFSLKLQASSLRFYDKRHPGIGDFLYIAKNVINIIFTKHLQRTVSGLNLKLNVFWRILNNFDILKILSQEMLSIKLAIFEKKLFHKRYFYLISRKN